MTTTEIIAQFNEYPPCTPETIEAAKLAADQERRKAAADLIDQGALDLVRRLGLPMDAVTAEQWARVDGIQALDNLADSLIQQFGAPRVCRWLRAIAAEKGGR